MKAARGFLACAVGLAALLSIEAQPIRGQDPVPDQEKLLQLHRELLESAILHEDSSVFAATTLPNFMVIPPGGIVETRAEALAGMAVVRADSLRIDDVRIVNHGSTAVIIARLVRSGGQPTVGTGNPIRAMNVFVYDGRQWRLLARSLTPCINRAVAAGRC